MVRIYSHMQINFRRYSVANNDLLELQLLMQECDQDLHNTITMHPK